MYGRMNWSNLTNYTVQAADMELFQTYMLQYGKSIAGGSRTKGLIFGGVISVVNNLTIQISAGVALMPDGQILHSEQHLGHRQ